MSLEHVGGRLTLLSQTPVFQSWWNPTLAIDSEEAQNSIVYWAPFYDNEISLNTSGLWVGRNALAQPSLNIPEPSTNGLPMDIWAYWTGTVVALDYTWWANATTRATGLVRNSGVLVKSGDASRRYLGTIAAYKGNNVGIVYDSPSKRHVYNYYNKVLRKLEKEEAASSWVYNTQSWREANGKTNENVVTVMQGWIDGTIAQVGIDAQYSVSTVGPTNKGLVGVVRGASGTPTVASIIAGCGWLANALMSTHSYTVDQLDDIGLHTFRWMEFGAASGNTTFYGGKKSGLRGVLWN